jgi:hypothetical protein
MLPLPSKATAIGLYFPLPPPPPLSPPSGHHRHHCHHRGLTHQCLLPKKEAKAAPSAAYQQQYQHKNIYKSRRLGLIQLIYQCKTALTYNFLAIGSFVIMTPIYH